MNILGTKSTFKVEKLKNNFFHHFKDYSHHSHSWEWAFNDDKVKTVERTQKRKEKAEQFQDQLNQCYFIE